MQDGRSFAAGGAGRNLPRKLYCKLRCGLAEVWKWEAFCLFSLMRLCIFPVDGQVVLDRMGKIGEEFKDWWSGGVCDDERADVAAENISDVLANLWLETAVQVKCTGVGFACGWSAVEAPAWFDSVGDALDLVAAEAGAKEVKFCAPDMQSLTKDEEVDIESARKEVRFFPFFRICGDCVLEVSPLGGFNEDLLLDMRSDLLVVT